MGRWAAIRNWLTAFLVSAATVAAAQYDPPANYYASITNQTGNELKTALRTIISNMVGVTYGDARYSAPYTDPDPNVPGNILLIYDRASVNGAWSTSPLIWNREHIWPESRLDGSASNGTANIASDQFNLRPSDPDINNARANKPFGVDDSSGNHGHRGDYYYPGDADAGDVARAQFYMATRYSQLSLTDATIPPSGGLQMADLSSLLVYHFKDVPDTFERRRNHAIYGLAGENSPAITNPYRQQNRNPFVDRPEYAWAVFGNGGNDSQITIAGHGDGATVGVDLGRVYVGGAGPATQGVTLNKSGQNGTYYQVTTGGLATSTVTGRYNAFRHNQTDSTTITVGLNASSATSGLKTGTVTIDNLDITDGGAGRGANDANDVLEISYAVLDHPVATFASNADLREAVIDFGVVPYGSGVHNVAASIYNLLEGGPSFAANLDLDSIDGSGDTGVLQLDLAPFVGLAQGNAIGFQSQLFATQPGQFSADYTLHLSDEDLPGEQLQTLSLSLVGQVLLFGDYNRDNRVDGGDYVTWRNSLGLEVDPYAGADGNGDMMIDEADYLVWKQYYGEAYPGPGGGGLGTQPVPEPGGWPLLLAAILTIGPVASRRR